LLFFQINYAGATRFSVHYPGLNLIRFKIVGSSPNSYLIIDNGMLKAGTASGGNEESEIVTFFSVEPFMRIGW